MGREATCAWTTGRQTRSAKLHLDGKRLDVRAGEHRVALDLSAARKVAALDGKLVVELGPRERHAFALGAAAPSWVAAISTTKTVAQKLGIVPEKAVAFAGGFERATIDELTCDAGAKRAARAKDAAIVLALAENETAAKKALALFATLDAKVATWIVFPKGKGVVFGETAVRALARGAGFMDVKVVGFSPTHSSLRFSRRS